MRSPEPNRAVRGKCDSAYTGIARDGRPYCIRKVNRVDEADCMVCPYGRYRKGIEQ